MKNERKVSFKKEPNSLKINGSVFYRLLFVINVIVLVGSIVAVTIAMSSPKANLRKAINEVKIHGDLTSVKSNLILDTKIEYNGVEYDIEWFSDNTDVITNFGRVTRPKNNESNVDVELRASLKEDRNFFKKFKIKVLKTDSVYEDALQLIILDHEIKEVDLTPTELVSSVTYLDVQYGVRWASSNEGSIKIDETNGNKGIVTLNVGPDTELKLTAYLYLNDIVEASREFPMGVKGRGDGTEQKPYLIYEASHMDLMVDKSSAFYELKRDIKLTNVRPISRFTGSFVGNQYSIELTGTLDSVNCPAISSALCYGIFGLLDNAKVSDLRIINAITSTTLTSHNTSYVGLLAARATTNTTISGVSLEGKAAGTTLTVAATSSINATLYVGGLFGQTNNVRISNTYSTANLTVNSTIRVSYVGGLSGTMSNTTVSQSYFSANVTMDQRYANLTALNLLDGTSYLGGFAGAMFDNSVIKESYSSGNVSLTASTTNTIDTMKQYIGGMLGNIQGSTIENSYVTNNVITTSRAAYVQVQYAGGMIGFTGKESGTAESDRSYVKKSYSTAIITVAYTIKAKEPADNGSATSYAGGLVGLANYVNFVDSFSTSTFTTRPIDITNKPTTHNFRFGGFTGYRTNTNYANTWQRLYTLSGVDGQDLCADTNYNSNSGSCQNIEPVSTNRLSRITGDDLLITERIYKTYKFNLNDSGQPVEIWDATTLSFDGNNTTSGKYNGPRFIWQMPKA